MINLITVEEAMLQIRADSDDAAEWIEMMIPSISHAVAAWLDNDEHRIFLMTQDTDGAPLFELDEHGEMIVHPIVKMACLVEIAQQDKNREGDGATQVPAHWGHGYTLCIGATALLSSIRRSVVA